MPIVLISKAEKEARKAAQQDNVVKKLLIKIKKGVKFKPKKAKANSADKFALWYENNRDEYNQKRREKYAKDPEYKARVRAGAKEWREEHKKPAAKHSLPPGCYSLKEVSALVGRNTQAITNWEVNGYIPPVARDKYGRRYYTDAQVALMRELIVGLRAITAAESRAGPNYRARVEEFTSSIKARWEGECAVSN